MTVTVRNGTSGLYGYASPGTGEATSRPPLPTGWQPGDVVYIAYALSTDTPATLTVPSGWTAVVPLFNSASSTLAAHGVLRRVMVAGDTGAAIAHTTGRFVSTSCAMLGVDTTTPEDVTPTFDDNAGIAYPSVNAPSITGVTPGCFMLTLHAARNASISASTSVTRPSGSTGLGTASTLATTGVNGVAIAGGMWGTAPLARPGVASGTRTGTASSSNAAHLINQMGSTIAVRSAANSGTVDVPLPLGMRGALNGKVGPLPSGTLDATLPAITTAAPEVASSSNTGFDESNSSTTVTIPVPVPTAAGQIALLAMELWGYDPDVAVTWPAGFTECVHVVESAYMQQKLVAAWKRLTEADTGDYVATLSLPHYNQGQCLLISGAVASGDPIEATNTASGSGTDVPSTSVTTAAPPFLVHLVAVARYQFDATPATGYTFLYKGSDLLSSQRIPRAIGSHTASGATVDYGDLAVALVAIKPEIQQMGGSVTPPPPAGISEWDGAARQSLRLVGVWDGAAVQPVSDGWWTGSAVAPVEH